MNDVKNFNQTYKRSGIFEMNTLRLNKTCLVEVDYSVDRSEKKKLIENI